MKIQKSETHVYRAVERGELEIDDNGRIWRTHIRQINRWTGLLALRPCARHRAEHQTSEKGKRGGCYLQVHMMENRIKFTASAHRLVYHHFFGPIPEGLTVNHKNGVVNDNRPENLELATQSEQAMHAIHVLHTARAANQNGERHHQSRFTNEQVIEVRRILSEGTAKERELATRFKVSQSTISAIRTRRYWAHLA